MDYWYMTTDNQIKLVVQNAYSEAYINNASVSGVLTDENGDAVSGADDITFNYESGSDGEYLGEIEDTVTLERGSDYTLTYTVVGSGYKFTGKMKRRAEYCGAT